MDTNKLKKVEQQAADQKLIDGLTKHATFLPTLVIGSTSYKTADIIGTLQARIDARNATASSRATWQAAVQAERDQRAKTQTVVSGLQQAVQVAFAGSIDALADFGLKPRKPRVMTPEQKTEAAAKAKATREARHTMGPKQKAKIKGTVSTDPAPATPPSTGGATTAPKATPTAS
jgi:hypothetical protein